MTSIAKLSPEELRSVVGIKAGVLDTNLQAIAYDFKHSDFAKLSENATELERRAIEFAAYCAALRAREAGALAAMKRRAQA